MNRITDERAEELLESMRHAIIKLDNAEVFKILLDRADAKAKIEELQAENDLSRAKIENMVRKKEFAVCIENYYDLLKEFEIQSETTIMSPFDALVQWRRDALARIASLESECDELKKLTTNAS